jgi:transposase InsO family protein
MSVLGESSAGAVSAASLRTDFVLDALEQAICDRCGAAPPALIHHSDRGTQYVSMRYRTVGRRGHRAVRGQSR